MHVQKCPTLVPSTLMEGVVMIQTMHARAVYATSSQAKSPISLLSSSPWTAVISDIRRQTLSNQSINQSINLEKTYLMENKLQKNYTRYIK